MSTSKDGVWYTIRAEPEMLAKDAFVLECLLPDGAKGAILLPLRGWSQLIAELLSEAVPTVFGPIDPP